LVDLFECTIMHGLTNAKFIVRRVAVWRASDDSNFKKLH
jgi:hypothetical protein